MELINIKNLSMKFKNNVVFEDLNFSCGKGEIIGIIGENGSGKSVLFKLMSGFILPTSGEINIQGVNITEMRAFPKDMGVLIEEPSFLPHITGFENLKLLASIKNTITDKQILETLDLVGLMGEKDQKVKTYSLGMKKKLAIAQAVMENQEIVILDEPMNALDEGSVKKMRSLFKNLAQEGKTIILASHNKMDIDELCTKVHQIKNHNLVAVS